MQNGRIRLALVCGLLFATGLAMSPSLNAQSGTPEAGVEMVSAAACSVEPRSVEELRALFREVDATTMPDDLAATPAPMPAGTPADEPIAEAVNGVWREIVACLSAGDQPRLFALYSDDMVRRQLQIDIAFGVTEDALIDYLEATPVPISDTESLSVDPLTDVHLLPDGRVAATKAGDSGRAEALIFIPQGDSWLLDAWFEDG
jgi:hypothetical protein